jgi:hypothetical protein
MNRPNSLAALALLFATSTAGAQVVGFETYPGGAVPAEGDAVGTQYLASHGVSFSLEGGGLPQLAVLGNPRVAFDGPGGVSDTPVAGQGLGSIYLTDDGVANQAPAAALILSYAQPVSVAGAELIDIDGLEAWDIEARDAGGVVIASLTLTAGDPGTGDGVATRWSIVRPTADIHSVRIVHVGAQVAVGWALDRVSPSLKVASYCTAGVSANGCQATLSAEGTPSAAAGSGFVVSATNVEGSKDGLFFYGASGRQANSWGNGTSYQCVVPPVRRAGLLTGVGTPGACDGTFSQDLNARWCATCPKPTHNPGVGTKVQLQLWHRDPLNTSNQTTSLSDALEFVVVP